MSATETPQSLARYLARFALFYLLFSIVSAMFFAAAAVKTNPGASLVILMLSAFLVAQAFQKANGRLMTKPERQRMIWGSFAIAIVLSIIVTLASVVYMMGGTQAAITSLGGVIGLLSGFAWSAIVVLTCALYLLVLWFSYDYLPRRMAASG